MLLREQVTIQNQTVIQIVPIVPLIKWFLLLDHGLSLLDSSQLLFPLVLHVVLLFRVGTHDCGHYLTLWVGEARDASCRRADDEWGARRRESGFKSLNALNQR